jgi:hypothetical protein
MTSSLCLAEAFIAGLATKIANFPDAPLDESNKFGFNIMRHLAKLGLRNNDIHSWLRYPAV